MAFCRRSSLSGGHRWREGFWEEEGGPLHRRGMSKRNLVGLGSRGMEVCPVETTGLQSRAISG